MTNMVLNTKLLIKLNVITLFWIVIDIGLLAWGYQQSNTGYFLNKLVNVAITAFMFGLFLLNVFVFIPVSFWKE